MKKILIILLGITIFQSCTFVPNPDNFYVDEDFVLIDKSIEEKVVNGNTMKVRTWKIQRIIINGDSVMVGEINDKNANGCNCSIITDELWNKRNVGDILHFDYIRKDRFIVEEMLTYSTNIGTEQVYSGTGTLTVTTDEPVEFKTVETAIINLNKLEIERRILEIEREIMSLERELEMLKNQK